MKLTEEQISKLNLDQTIQAYALSMGDVDYSHNRVLLHMHLCELLGVPYSLGPEGFNPLRDYEFSTATIEPWWYERELRRAINELSTASQRSSRVRESDNTGTSKN